MADFRRLQLLLELSQRGPIAAVAAATSYSTSAISQQLASLERELGVSLLEPDGRRLKLTAAGRALVARAPGLLEAWEEARSATRRSTDELSGQLRLAVFQTAYLSLIPPLVRELAVQHPRLELVVSQAEPHDATPALLARDLDAAIIEEYPGFPGSQSRELHRTNLVNDPMLLVIPAADVAPYQSMSQLAHLAWALEPSGSAVRGWAEAVCREHGFEPRVTYETSDILTQVELVRSGLAAAFIPSLMPKALRTSVSVLPLPGRDRTIQLVHRISRRDDPSIEVLSNTLANLMGKTAD